MATHSSLVGGSTAARVLACPPSRVLSEHFTRVAPPSEHAIRGTALHDIMEKIVSDGTEPKEFRDQTMLNEDGHTYTVTEDDVLDLEAAESAVKQLQFEGIVYLEHLVEIPDLPGAFGTIDLCGHGRMEDGGPLYPVVADYKFGKGIQVDVEDNAQLRFYAAAAALGNAPELQHVFEGYTDVILAIIQPNDQGRPLLRMELVDTVKLFDFARLLKQAVELGADGEYQDGDHCRWCPAKLACPHLNAIADHALAAGTPTEAEAIAAALDKIDGLEHYISEVRSAAMTALNGGHSIPGYKLVPKRAIRRWTDEEKVKQRLSDLGDDIFAEPKLRSPKQLEAMAADASIPIEDLIVKQSSGNVVAPESDKRAAVTKDPLALFAKRQAALKLLGR